MRARSAQVLLAVGLVGCTALGFTSAVGARRSSQDPALAAIERARTAAVAQPFTAVVEVSWNDGGTMQTKRVNIAGDGSQMYADGVVLGAQGFRVGTTESPAIGSQQTPSTMPTPNQKYRLKSSPGTPVLDRPTTVVDASVDGVVRERWTLDDNTGVLIGRDAYNSAGELTRRVALVELAWTGPPTPPTTMPPPKDKVSETEIATVKAPFAAPATVGAGYRIVGRYRMDDGTIHLLYSDGLRDLSVFQQRGDLDWGSLPAEGRTEVVGGVKTRQYLAASGWTWIWERNGVVVTVVTDTTADELPAVVSELKPVKPSGWDRFRSWVRGLFG
jgi:hypothetical protein